MENALDQFAGGAIGRTASGGATLRCPTSRTSIRDHRRTNLPNSRHGLRAAKRPSHQPLDGTGNSRRSDASRDCAQDLCTTCRSCVKKRDLKPHLIRYWLTPPDDPQKEATIGAICQVYRQAPELAKQGERTMSTDELTGVQALERKHPGLPLAPGKVERREFEYMVRSVRSKP